MNILCRVCILLAGFSACGTTNSPSHQKAEDVSLGPLPKSLDSTSWRPNALKFQETMYGSGWMEVRRYEAKGEDCGDNAEMGEDTPLPSYSVCYFLPQKVVEALPVASIEGKNTVEGAYSSSLNDRAMSWTTKYVEILGTDTFRMESTTKWTLKEWSQNFDTLVVCEEEHFKDRYEELHVGRYITTYRRLTNEEVREIFKIY